MGERQVENAALALPSAGGVAELDRSYDLPAVQLVVGQAGRGRRLGAEISSPPCPSPPCRGFASRSRRPRSRGPASGPAPPAAPGRGPRPRSRRIPRARPCPGVWASTPDGSPRTTTRRRALPTANAPATRLCLPIAPTPGIGSKSLKATPMPTPNYGERPGRCRGLVGTYRRRRRRRAQPIGRRFYRVGSSLGDPMGECCLGWCWWVSPIARVVLSAGRPAASPRGHSRT